MVQGSGAPGVRMTLPSASCLVLLLVALHGARGESCGNWGDSDECAGENAGAIKRHHPINSESSLQYSIFMGMQYYGPPEPLSTYHAIAAAAKKLAPAPFYISVCCDHNDGGGGAENRSGDPADGGWIVPICRRNDTEGAAVRAGIAVLREAGVHVLHYTHTRLAYWPNGSEYKCCQCCEKLSCEYPLTPASVNLYVVLLLTRFMFLQTWSVALPRKPRPSHLTAFLTTT